MVVTKGHAVDFHREKSVIIAATWYFIYHYATVYVQCPSSTEPQYQQMVT